MKIIGTMQLGISKIQPSTKRMSQPVFKKRKKISFYCQFLGSFILKLPVSKSSLQNSSFDSKFIYIFLMAFDKVILFNVNNTCVIQKKHLSSMKQIII